MKLGQWVISVQYVGIDVDGDHIGSLKCWIQAKSRGIQICICSKFKGFKFGFESENADLGEYRAVLVRGEFWLILVYKVRLYWRVWVQEKLAPQERLHVWVATNPVSPWTCWCILYGPPGLAHNHVETGICTGYLDPFVSDIAHIPWKGKGFLSQIVPSFHLSWFKFPCIESAASFSFNKIGCLRFIPGCHWWSKLSVFCLPFL